MLCLPSLTVFAALLGAAATAQNLQPANAVIEGRVSSLLSGDSLRKAQVTVRNENGAVAARGTTDANGRFALSIQAGKYRLSAERTGYCEMEFGARGPGRPGSIVVAAAGETLKDMDLTLVPLSSIAGRLVDEERDPLPGATIYCLGRRYFKGHYTLQPEWVGTTNDRGEFRAGGLEPGQYFVVGVTRLQLSVTRQTSKTPSSDERYVPTYYPGTTELERAVPIVLRPGTDFEGLELTPVRKPVAQVRGRISPFNPEAPSKPSIVLTTATPDAPTFLGARAGGVRDKEGNFEIDAVPAGSYVLSAEWSDGNRRYYGRQTLDVGSTDRNGITLLMTPGTEVVGRVLGAGSNSAAYKIRVRLADGAGTRAMPMADVTAGGLFAFTAVPPDTYTIELNGMPEGAYLESIKVAGVDITYSDLDLTQGPLPGAVEIAIRTEGAQVDGTVVDRDRNLTWATVVLAPDASRRRQAYWYRTAQTDQYGRFTLKGVAPGEYTLLAWEDVEGDAYRDPAFLKRFEASGEKVSVGRGERKSAQVKLVDVAGNRPEAQ